jgi:hypothetical protein
MRIFYTLTALAQKASLRICCLKKQATLPGFDRLLSIA